ncbi:MAG: TM0106 family RecB-like putative nuclease, partial [Nocardioidaceae bacterium]
RGDIFFDFEGDPLYNDGDLSRWGLEYLFGVMEAAEHVGQTGAFKPLWAHSREDEREAVVAFMDYVEERRCIHPDMHIYHYAAYETSALKRLTANHSTHERELDDLLRAGVFVDLYAVVRGSLRISQPSYSIKKLEPLYMPREELRTGEVQAGDTSIIEYHEFRTAIETGDEDVAATKLADLADYNEYDCLSTMWLRDWLLGVGQRHGVTLRSAIADVDAQVEQDEEQDDLIVGLRAQAGPEQRTERTPDEQGSAMLAAAIGYHRRERLPYWWDHFNRLRSPTDEWATTRDVLIIDTAEVVEPWASPSERSLPRRTLCLRGQFGIGSTVHPGQSGRLLYDAPVPEGLDIPIDAVRGCTKGSVEIDQIDADETGRDIVVVRERVRRECATYDALPMALAPGDPVMTKSIDDAIREVAQSALGGSPIPEQPAIDVLSRRRPRFRTPRDLPHSGDGVDDIVAALLSLDRSYLPVQGPPGSGKTYSGARVIARLVSDHGWRIGVVAQSHAVVENMLDAIVQAGLDPELVAKKDAHAAAHAWREINDSGYAELFDEAAPGFVLGGTAWTFTSAVRVPRVGLDLLVIDEAGQFSLATTIGVSVCTSRLLLLGDPQQLPQVSQGTHGEPVDTSALRWVMGDHDAMPPELGYFMSVTYRMHPDLCAPVSRLSYEGKLRSHLCTTERSLAGVRPGLHVVPVEHRGNSVSSDEEADEVVVQVRRLLNCAWQDPRDAHASRPLGALDFLVVAPFNAQVQLIRRRLTAAGLHEVPVGTVDKFQGQQAPVVIVSMTASAQEDVPRGMEFLLSRNRVNVAVSRAQWLAVLIRSESLTSYLPGSAAGLLELGAFIGLCEAGSA